jgi:3'-5' exoribonuclease
MDRQFMGQLADGDSVDEVYLVVEKQLRANRNGNLYLQLDLRDRTGAMGARLWNVGEPVFRTFEAGDFLHVKGKVQLFQGALQMILSHIERVPKEEVDLTDFLPHTEKDVSKLYERLRALLMKLEEPHLRALGECFLMDQDFVQAFCRAPAGIRIHHAYLGGLLEHVVTLLDAAERIAGLYPELNRDLLMMGVFLHDIGKVRELTYDQSFAYSNEGQLLGHLIIGVEMLDAKVKQVVELLEEPFPEELRLRLAHMILSHHGSYEFGSPKLPMTPEAIALHYLDNLDAKVHIFLRAIREDRGPSLWTSFNPSLDRRLFKGAALAEDPLLSMREEE